jgi:hypothetical protein
LDLDHAAGNGVCLNVHRTGEGVGA